MNAHMSWLKYYIVWWWMLFGVSGFAAAQSAGAQTDEIFVSNPAIICPASATDMLPPDKTGAECRDVNFQDIDPQGKHIWVFLELRLPAEMLDSYEPLGLGISAKAASIIYINGREIGRNGLPSDTARTETAGRMDTVFPLREGALVAGQNDIAIRLSSHLGALTLGRPVHNVRISTYESPQSRILRRYSPSLLPFGVFILGALYFLVMSIVGKQRIKAALLSVMSATIGVQLFSEVSRGLFAYTYPWHDTRLIVILLCSAFFGALLSFYIARVFERRHQWRWLAVILLVTLLAMLVPKDFDVKATTSLLSQTVLSLTIALFYWQKNLRKTTVFSAALLIFGIINLLTQAQFLDVYFFYVIALLMLFLFGQQALAYGQEQALHQEEQIRANKLQLVLDQRQEESQPAILSLSEAGKIHRIAADDIISISGADDYIEVLLKTGKTRLISSTLAEMETQLPSFFLRVHRSHIVNTNFIKSLIRETSGTGSLTLVQGKIIPVSRRIMPSVRRALN